MAGRPGGKITAQKQGVPTIYSLMQIGPGSQASEEGHGLSLITALQGHGGGRGWTLHRVHVDHLLGAS